MSILPDGDSYRQFSLADDTNSSLANQALSLSEVAKLLGLAPLQFMQKLQGIHWIFKRQSSSAWQGYQRKVTEGIVVHRPVTISHNSGDVEYRLQVLITSKGINCLEQHKQLLTI
ncbi:MAG: hypothetical protein EOO69_11215 [Moraxellaceae bacterium]|nr:MAG: hypothetical protein EOO69_11215 [Moraxellaceae bacterium]